MSYADVHYEVRPVDPAAHLFQVVMTLTAPHPEGQRLALPTWIPGSYMIREFARNVIAVEASDAGGPVGITKVDKTSWRVEPCEGPLEVTCTIYAWERSVRAAHLDQSHGFFNGTSLFLAAEGQEDKRHTVTLVPPTDPACADWRVATAMRRVNGEPFGFGTFEADSHDELIDHPVELGTFDHLRFEACGVPHDLCVTGVHRGDLQRLADDLVPICEHHIRMFGEPAPVDRYVFLLTVTGDGYGGLEHRASSANICKRADLPTPGMTEVGEGYRTLLGLLSHEYFHTWNVKRIKPKAFVPYDLSREGYTEQLWVFEGITSYYDDLALLRTERISMDDWLELVGRTATRVWRGSGRHKQSLAASSFDAWTKFYRQDENAPNAIVSYYAKGALVAMALDLHLRRVTDERVGLDAVMRTLWARYGDGSGVPEGAVEAVAEELAGVPLASFFDRAVRGTDDLDFADLLDSVGVLWNTRPATSAKDKGGKAPSDKDTAPGGFLGATVVPGSGGAKLKHVHDGGPARAAGLSAGDVVVAFDGLRVKGGDLVDRARALPPGTVVPVVAFREDVLVEATVTLGEPAHDTVWLTLHEEPAHDVVARRARWVGGSTCTA